MAARIRQELLGCSIYLYPDEQAARAGERAGGSGFMLGRPFPAAGPDQCTLWAVTNRHVIEQGNWSIRINTVFDGFDVIETNEQEWFFHPENDDLAIRPLATAGGYHRVNYLTTDWLLTKDTLDLYVIGPGDPCFVIGRFINHEGRQRNTPTVRFGEIAQSPIEKVSIGGIEQESFLVEIRSIGGYSGSPVFVWLDQAHYRPIDENTAPDGRKAYRGVFDSGPWLLGVDWCMVPLWEAVHDKHGDELPNGWQVPVNTGMMGVIPAWRLHWLVMECPEVVAHAAAIEAAELERLAAIPPATILTDVSKGGMF